MTYEVIKIKGDYSPNVLLPIWKEALDELDIRRIEWSYNNNINGFPDVYCLRNLADSEIFGSLTIFPRKYRLSEKLLEGGTTGDYAIKKRFRSLGPALSLQRNVLKSMKHDQIIIGFPNKIAEKIQMRAGFKLLGNMVFYTKPIRAQYIINKLDRFILLRYFNRVIDILLFCRDFKIKKNKTLLIFNKPQDISIRFDRIWDECKNKFSFIGDRSFKYLFWRYFENPYHDYKLFAITQEEKLLGYIIYRVSDCNVIVDDFLWNGINQHFNDLFYLFTIFCKKSGYNSICLQIFENNKIDELLRKNYFIGKRIEKKVLIANLDMPSVTNIFLTKGDDDF